MPQRLDSGPVRVSTVNGWPQPGGPNPAVDVDQAQIEADAQAAALEAAFEEKRRKFEADLAAKEAVQLQRIAQMEAQQKMMPELHAKRVAELKKAKDEEERKAREKEAKKKQDEIDKKARAAKAKAKAEAAQQEALAMQAAEEHRRAEAAATAKQQYLGDLRAIIVRGLKDKHIELDSTVGDLLSM